MKINRRMHPNSAYDAFLIKLTPGGEYVWGRSWGGYLTERAFGLTSDYNGNVYVCGDYYYTVDFDPGPGIEEHTSNGGVDVFLSKFPPDGNW